MNHGPHRESERAYIEPYYDTAFGTSEEGQKQIGLPMGTTKRGEIQFIADGIKRQLEERNRTNPAPDPL